MHSGANLILYGMNSPNVTKVAIMLEELELTYELRHVAVFGGEQFSPDEPAHRRLGRALRDADRLGEFLKADPQGLAGARLPRSQP